MLKADFIKNKTILKTLGGLDFSNARALIKLKIGKIQKHISCQVVKNHNFSYDLLLGLDAIKAFQLIQDQNLRIFQKLADDKMIEISQHRQLDNLKQQFAVNFNEYININEFEANLDHIQDNDKKTKIINLIERYKSIFAKDKYDVGCITASEAQIKLFKDEYIYRRPYKCSLPDRQEIETQVKNLLERGLIEESSSAYGAPITLAYKKGDERPTRLCIDFSSLNKLVVPECHPFPKIDDVLERVANCKYFTTLDVNSAFWCIPIRLEDREKTSFVTERNHYQWRVLPFGLKTSSQIFQRILANIIRRNGLEAFSINYIDDILIFSETFEDHLKHIQQFLDAVKKEGFRLKLVKCTFAAESVKYLGHQIEKNKVTPAQENLVSIQKLQRPVDKSGVRSVLGSINYFLRYVENPSKKFEPLHNLLRKNVPFVWSQQCEDVFNEIKTYLCSKPVLAIFDPNKQIVIETDASKLGLAAAFKQPQEDNILHPVFYFSRKLSQSEKKLGAIHIECKAIKEAIQFWQYYLIGREFIVRSDHKPLESLRTKARTDEMLGDMMFYFSQFNFTILHKRGKDNIMADLMSRYPVLERFECEDAIKIVNLIQLDQITDDQKNNQTELIRAKKTVRHGDLIYKQIRNRTRVFVSQQFGEMLIRLVHEQLGHIGSPQLAKTIRRHYYFRNLDQMVSDYCKSCTTCIENKSRRGRLIGLMSHLGPSTEPYQIMSIDSVGGFANNRSTKSTCTSWSIISHGMLGSLQAKDRTRLILSS